MKLFLKCLVIVLLSLTNHPIYAQIISTGHTASTPTIYPVHSGIDSIYFYPDVSLGTLTAMPVGGSNVNYTWYKFESNNWTELTSGNDPELSIPLEETAYRVSVTDNGNPVGEYQCWIFKPEILTAEIDTILNTCTSLQQAVKTTTKPLNYFDLTSFEQISLDYSFSYLWSSMPEGDINGKIDADPLINAPVDSTTFSVTISAFNGAHELSDDNKFGPIAVKADFTFDVTDRENENEYPKSDKYVDITSFEEGSASVLVSINNKSKGAINRYKWEVYDEEDNLYTDDIGANPSAFEFTEPTKSYYIKLVVRNTTRACEDDQQQGPIKVVKIKIDVPNVFTPDGDGINDKFMVGYESVNTFKMVIVNRWGRKVFQTTNPADYWDGKIGGRKAAAGVYFYYIEAKGFNGERKKLEGPVHLLRGN